MKKYTIQISLVWIILCIFTILIYQTGSDNFKWIDIPTHFSAGIMIGAILFTISKQNIKKTVLLSFFIFIVWEFFEITAAASSEKEFIINIFSEPTSNRIQDILMDFLGLASFFLIYKKFHNKLEIPKINLETIDE